MAGMAAVFGSSDAGRGSGVRRGGGRTGLAGFPISIREEFKAAAAALPFAAVRSSSAMRSR